MREPYQDPKPFNRRWIAWKLVQLAWRIYDPDYYERIWIEGPGGELIFDAEICSDLYGSGVSTMFHRGEIPAGSTVHHDHDYRPDWES
jgi:hypothetical protein